MDNEKCPLSVLCTSRRQFLGGTGAGLLGYAISSSTGVLSAAEESQLSTAPRVNTQTRPKIGVIFSHITPDEPTWPYKGYDYEGRKKQLSGMLTEACPDIKFEFHTAMNAEEGQSAIKAMADVDGLVAYPVGIWTGVPAVVARAGKPAILVDDLYAGTGEFIEVRAQALREQLPVVAVASSDFHDVVKAIRTFEAIKRIQGARILDVNEEELKEISPIKTSTGIEVERLTFAELNSYYEKADEGQAAQWAEKWMRGAKKVVEPTREEVIKSGKMHLALVAVMKDRAAEAITIDCLGGFYGGKLPAYPCLSFHTLNNEGHIGACEADLNSTVTMIMMKHLVSRPGMISDPVFDLPKRQIIYAHCVAPNRVYGSQGTANPYILRSHAEDNRGAAVQSLLPLGQVVTTVQTNVMEKAIVVHSGKTVADIDDPKGCRTKLATEVNAQKILDNWRWGWHRVTFYGDWRQDVKNLATLMQFRLYEEDV
jgi:hypothetical protein